ncbi:uncharacterized protein V1516DRAFT_687355 [Lipomyces oligophaga]|uniref:uncharacterized protein n=1 Tax=Lipomyces oligophaga TaxID=45792 RepID=UPI0034CD4B1B
MSESFEVNVKPEFDDIDDDPEASSKISVKPAHKSRRAMVVNAVPKSTKPPGELLTAEEKKANHIASEQKRRQAIRDGFDKLTDIVPGLTKSQGRSEAIVLQKTLEYLKQELQRNQQLTQQVQDLGGQIPPELMLSTNDMDLEASSD